MPAAYSEFTGKKQKPHPGGAQKREPPQPTLHARNDSSAQTRETPYTTNAPKGRILKLRDTTKVSEGRSGARNSPETSEHRPFGPCSRS